MCGGDGWSGPRVGGDLGCGEGAVSCILCSWHLWGAQCCLGVLSRAPVPFGCIKAWAPSPPLPLSNCESTGSCHWWDSCNLGPSGVQLRLQTAACTLGRATFAGMSQLTSEQQPAPRFSPIRVCRAFLLMGPGGVQGRASSKENIESEEQTLRGAYGASVTAGCQGDAGWAPALLSRRQGFPTQCFICIGSWVCSQVKAHKRYTCFWLM